MGVVAEVEVNNALGHSGYSTYSVPTPRKITGKSLALSKENTFFCQVNVEYLHTYMLQKYST